MVYTKYRPLSGYEILRIVIWVYIRNKGSRYLAGNEVRNAMEQATDVKQRAL